jgi:hypothetical protein
MAARVAALPRINIDLPILTLIHDSNRHTTSCWLDTILKFVTREKILYNGFFAPRTEVL